MAISRRLASALVLLAALGAAVAAYALTEQNAAPATPAVTFTTLDGRQIRLQGQQGKIVMVIFWATNCSICMGEMPDLIETYRQYQARGFELIAVAMAYDDPEQVRKFARSKGLPFPVVLDTSGSLARSFNDTKVVPTIFLIDKKGNLVSRTLGAIDFSKLHQYLNRS
ncbi:Redoxin domain protein [Acidithiobacillus ferrooxidans ATCC 53993]|uniref:TlpA disulfide reductase family protein n=1 Tax=Acidithiobacillus ferrooxidans TaxID=920 RepID=UPI00017F6CE3|nr:TlpA disulfide reductase family protein [Acidithiobacillus ferrooxidans]ACH82465.1 Redoxin domain protein [Acidithiobacillus ferrooxidans ATCC 53993]